MEGCEVVVKEYKGVVGDNKDILVSSITLNQQTGSVAQNGKLQLQATISPSTATNKSLRWSSSNPSVATVDQTGLVTAISAGTATITVAAQDGSNVKASCVVQVTGGGLDDGHYNPPVVNPPVVKPPTIQILYYIVNFDANGGENLSRKKMTLLQDDYLGILPKVERKNYSFIGWYTQPTGGMKVQQEMVFNASTTVFASWKEIVKPSKIIISSAKSKKAGRLELKWKKASMVKGYEVAYSTKLNFKSVKKKTVTRTSLTLKGLKKKITIMSRFVDIRLIPQVRKYMDHMER